MCGLTGFWQPSGFDASQAAAIAQSMATRLVARGPDDEGVWVNADAGLALAHRRLAVIDLSAAGHQPMPSASGRFVLVFNGEIYNHLDLRLELERGGAIAWRGHSDTETLLACFEAWGIESTLRKTVGMFAFAAWDARDRALTLARDRLGEKPLYYGWQGDGSKATLLFGSELKALKAHPSFQGRVDRDSICSLLRHSYIPAPHSIYQGIRKVLPGHMIVLSDGGRRQTSTPYWSLADAIAVGRADPLACTPDEALAKLERHLTRAVNGQMLADVPLGAFLSGGIDSSTIVALMQAQSSRPVKTFTIGFQEDRYNEAGHAKAVARHLGTDHTEVYVTSKQALDLIPHLPRIYDEPFADSSQIPTYMVSQVARGHVTVALSGDAGDELFAGYPRYAKAMSMRARLPASSHPLSRLGRMAADALQRIDRFSRRDRWQQLQDLLTAESHAQFYRPRVSHWKRPTELVLGATEQSSVFSQPPAVLQTADLLDSMMAIDSLSYLPDDILVKVDRAAMAVSLETRVPLLDHRVVEFAWRVPRSMKLHDGQGKWLLRKLLHRYVPAELVERPKMGFGVPIDEWLRGPLRDWAESLLNEGRLRREGYLAPGPVRKMWQNHLHGGRDWQYHLWDVLMFQAWQEAQAS